MFELWPKHKSGIREDYQKQPVIRALNSKWKALHILVMLHGQQKNDLWMQKRPNKYVSKVEREVKIKVGLLESGCELFPLFKHPTGCSLQFIIMVAECLGGADWYEQYINRHDEAEPDVLISETKLEELLKKVVPNNGNHKAVAS